MKINYIKLILLNYFYLFLYELIFKILVIRIFDFDIIYMSLFTIPVAIFLTFIMSLFKNIKVNRIISILIWIIIFFIFSSETIYYSFYKTICGFSALIYGGQVMEFFEAILNHIKSNILVLILYSIPFLQLILLSFNKVIIHEKFKKKETFALFLSLLAFDFTLLEYNKEKSDINALFYKTNDLMESTNTFGIFPSILLDTFKLSSGFEEEVTIQIKRNISKNENLEEYNITNIDFDNLIENEKDKTIKNMHIYFQNQEATNKNEYTGIFAGKNLIFITAEGFYPIAVDENITPTLYKLVNSSFIFSNYYQPIYNCSTSDGEFINQLSILPGVATCSMKKTSNVYLPYNVGMISKDYGYNQYAFHGWTYNYYSRDKTLPNLGYNYYGYDRNKRGYKNALKGIKDSWPTSDIDVVNSSYDIYKDASPFVTYYMSISGHLEYNFAGGNAMASKNKKVVSEIKAKDKIKAYIATQVEFDRSLELLMQKLESDGILDDTVIVISADHYPYGLTNEDIKSYADWMVDPNFDLYKNNLVIYNSKLDNQVISKNTSSLDLLPTLLNLFGFTYDSRLLIGNDIFSSSKDLVIFNNKSWITDKGKYDYIKKKFISSGDEQVSEEYIKEINEIVKLKFQMSKLLISKDYYRKVLGD